MSEQSEPSEPAADEEIVVEDLLGDLSDIEHDGSDHDRSNSKIEPSSEPSSEGDSTMYRELDQHQPGPSQCDEILECSTCDFKTNRPNSLAQHSKTRIYCPHCPQVFCGKNAKRHHKSHLRSHDFKPKNASICEQCQKPFQNASKLKNHKIRSKC